MDRRKFLETSCKTGLAVVVAGLSLKLDGLQTVIARSRRSPQDEVREIPLMFEDTPELEKIGSGYHLQIEDLGKDLLIARVSSAKFVAVDIKCRHKGCDVAYESTEKHFACPCHGSLYELDGSVKQGPTAEPLTSYETVVTETELIIRIPMPSEG